MRVPGIQRPTAVRHAVSRQANGEMHVHLLDMTSEEDQDLIQVVGSCMTPLAKNRALARHYLQDRSGGPKTC